MDRFYKPSVVVLLSLLLITQLAIVAGGVAQMVERAAIAAQMEELQVRADALSNLISQLPADYEESAYGNSVDRITEQQLIAEETQITELLHLAAMLKIMSEMIALMAATP